MRRSALGEEARMRTYEDVLLWLADALEVNPCFHAAEPHAGLALSQKSARQKCRMAATGLLVTHAFRDRPYRESVLCCPKDVLVWDGVPHLPQHMAMCLRLQDRR